MATFPTTIWHTTRQQPDGLALICTNADGSEDVFYTEACINYARQFTATRMTMVGWAAWRIAPVFSCPDCGAEPLADCDPSCSQHPDSPHVPPYDEEEFGALCWCTYCEADRAED